MKHVFRSYEELEKAVTTWECVRCGAKLYSKVPPVFTDDDIIIVSNIGQTFSFKDKGTPRHFWVSPDCDEQLVVEIIKQ